MPSESVIARIAEWLQSIWTDPAAAAEFAESPATSLAAHDLSQSDLEGVNLRSVAGGLGGSGGLSPEGQSVLTQYSSNPAPPVHHVTPVHEVAHVTRQVHHDNPAVARVFNDNRVFIDNSSNIDNRGGFIGGDINFDNDITIASGRGAVAAGEGANVNAATGAGSVANVGGEVNQANGPGSQVVSRSGVGQQSVNSDGSVLDQGGSVHGANTGANSGVVGGGGIDHTIDGGHNQQGNVDSQGQLAAHQGEQGAQQGGQGAQRGGHSAQQGGAGAPEEREPSLDFGGGDRSSGFGDDQHGGQQGGQQGGQHGGDGQFANGQQPGGLGDHPTHEAPDPAHLAEPTALDPTHEAPDPTHEAQDSQQPFHSAEHSPFHAPVTQPAQPQDHPDDPLGDHHAVA